MLLCAPIGLLAFFLGTGALRVEYGVSALTTAASLGPDEFDLLPLPRNSTCVHVALLASTAAGTLLGRLKEDLGAYAALPLPPSPCGETAIVAARAWSDDAADAALARVRGVEGAALWVGKRTVEVEVERAVRGALVAMPFCLAANAAIFAFCTDARFGAVALWLPLPCAATALLLAAAVSGATFDPLTLIVLFVALSVCYDDLCVLYWSRKRATRSVVLTSATSSIAALANLTAPLPSFRRVGAALVFLFPTILAAVWTMRPRSRTHPRARLRFGRALAGALSSAALLAVFALTVVGLARAHLADAPLRDLIFSSHTNLMRFARCHRDDPVEVVWRWSGQTNATFASGPASMPCPCDTTAGGAACAARAGRVGAYNYAVSSLQVPAGAPLDALRRAHASASAFARAHGLEHASAAWGDMHAREALRAFAGRSVCAGAAAIFACNAAQLGFLAAAMLAAVAVSNALFCVAAQALAFGEGLGFVDVLMTALLVGSSADFCIHMHVHNSAATLAAVTVAATTTAVASAGMLCAAMLPLRKAALYLLASVAHSYAVALAQYALKRRQPKRSDLETESTLVAPAHSLHDEA